MAIPVRCPHCDARLQYPDRFEGRTTGCRSCGEEIEIFAETATRSRSSKSGQRKGSRKKSNANAGLTIGIIAGCGLAGIVAIGATALVLFRNPPQIIAVQEPVPAANGPATVPLAAQGAPPPVVSLPGQPVEPVAGTPPTAVASVPGNKAPAITAGPTGGAKSGFQKSIEAAVRLSFAPPTEWKLAADPPASLEPLVSQKPLKLKLHATNLRDEALLFPVTPSSFVAFREKNGFQEPYDLYQLTTGQKVGQFPSGSGSGKLALSPGGKFAALSGNDSITVFDLKTKKSLGELSLVEGMTRFRVSSLAMPRDDRLVALSLLERGAKVWEIPSGNLVATVKGGDKFSPTVGVSFSPGGKYLAVNGDYLAKNIEIYDLDTGTVAATFVPEQKPHSTELAATGFSADGSEFAILYENRMSGAPAPTSQFVVWSLKNGEITSDFDLEPSLKERLEPEYQKGRLESFPDGRRWLVHNMGLLDRDQQTLIETFPKLEKVDLNITRKVMAKDWIVTVSSAKDLRLENLAIDEQSLAASAKSLAAGALPIDQGLQPLTAVDYAEAPAASATTEWKVTLDPAAQVGTVKPNFSIEAGTAELRDLVVSNGSDPLITVRMASLEELQDGALMSDASMPAQMRRTLRRRPLQPVAQKNTIVTCQASSGEVVSKWNLPFSGELMSITPDGKLALVALHRGKGRLDLLSLSEEGKAVSAFRPYRTAKQEDDRELHSALFVQNDRLVTLNSQGELVLWKIEGLQPEFRLDEVNLFTLSPGGKYLAAIRGNSLEDKELALFETASGDGCGTIPLDGSTYALQFSSDGKWIALSQKTETNSYITIIDVTTGTAASRFPVPGSASHVQWANDDFLLLGGTELISRQFQAVVWTYERGKAVLSPQQIGDQFLLATPAGNRWQIHLAKLPQPEVATKLDGAQLGNLAVLKPGDEVFATWSMGAEPELASFKDNALAQLNSRLTAAGLKVTERPQAIQVAGQLSMKSSGNATLSKIGDRAVQETVQVKTIELIITYQKGGRNLWTSTRRVGNMDHFIVNLKNGETAQGAIDKMMTQRAEHMLKTLELPAYVFGEDSRKGLGRSSLASLK